MESVMGTEMEDTKSQVQLQVQECLKKQEMKVSRTLQIFLRSLVSMVTLGATVTMAVNEQTSIVDGVAISASFKSSPTLLFFMLGNGVACAYTLLSLPLVSYYGNICLVQLMDMLAMALIIASASAATAIGYVGKEGNKETGWSPVCNSYETFCFKASIALLGSYLAFLLLYSAYALSCIQKAITVTNKTFHFSD